MIGLRRVDFIVATRCNLEIDFGICLHRGSILFVCSIWCQFFNLYRICVAMAILWIRIVTLCAFFIWFYLHLVGHFMFISCLCTLILLSIRDTLSNKKYHWIELARIISLLFSLSFFLLFLWCFGLGNEEIVFLSFSKSI